MDGPCVRTESVRDRAARAIAPALLLLLLGAASLPAAQKPDKKKPAPAPTKALAPPALQPWTGKYDDAKQNAKDRNVPLVVHVLLDGEEATGRYVKSVLEDPELLRKSQACVVIISDNGTHAKKDVDVVVDGQKRKQSVCSELPMFTACSQHQASWDGLYRDFQEEGGILRCPQTLVISPTGEIVLRFNTGSPPDAGEVVANIEATQAKCGPGLTQTQLDEVRRLLDVGRNLTTSKSWTDAWKTYAAVLAITTNTVYGQEAAKGQAAALSGMQQDLEHIAEKLVPGKAVKAYQDLVAFGKSAAGTPIEKDVAARIKKADGDKAIKDELSAWRLSVEADQILSQARDCYDQKNEKKGEQLVRKLFGKKYAATGAADVARKLWPDIARDEESKTPPVPR
jgi:hypothetical protein